MDPLVVIVPTRGRPQNIARLIEGWQQTGATAQLSIVVDDDDPAIDGYLNLLDGHFPPFVEFRMAPRIRLGPTLNREAVRLAEQFSMIGFMGDDHLPRTDHWDDRIRAALAITGVVYGNDLLQKDALPTAVFMTSDMVRALGYMCPPELVHMYLDNTWRDWGQAMGRYTYLPDVIIEHIHPVARKAEYDPGYAEADGFMGPDHDAYNLYRHGDEFATDTAALHRLVNS